MKFIQISFNQITYQKLITLHLFLFQKTANNRYYEYKLLL